MRGVRANVADKCLVAIFDLYTKEGRPDAWKKVMDLRAAVQNMQTPRTPTPTCCWL